MGTRNLQMVVLNGDFRAANYAQWDGYPGGQGITALEFLRDKMDKEVFTQKVSQCTWITEEEFKQLWIDCGANPKEDWVSLDVSDQFKDRNLHLHRDCGANIYQLIQNSPSGLKLQNNVEFAGNSSCNWGYVIDLDKNTFEVYRGTTKEPLSKEERFAHLEGEHGYSPIRLIKSYSLDNLPTNKEFTNDFKEPEEY